MALSLAYAYNIIVKMKNPQLFISTLCDKIFQNFSQKIDSIIINIFLDPQYYELLYTPPKTPPPTPPPTPPKKCFYKNDTLSNASLETIDLNSSFPDIMDQLIQEAHQLSKSQEFTKEDTDSHGSWEIVDDDSIKKNPFFF